MPSPHQTKGDVIMTAEAKIKEIEARIEKMKTNQNYHRIEEGGGKVVYLPEYYTMESRIEQAYDEIDELYEKSQKEMA